MLYELIAVARPGQLAEVKELARAAGSIVLSQKGVVRNITNWGTYLLTKPISRHQTRYHEGHHFIMRFDCSPSTQAAVKKMLGLDPRILRYGVVRLGDGTLKSSAQYSAPRWTRKTSWERERKDTGEPWLRA